jgi:hypothetical protein
MKFSYKDVALKLFILFKLPCKEIRVYILFTNSLLFYFFIQTHKNHELVNFLFLFETCSLD